jgi:hypothetical protein
MLGPNKAGDVGDTSAKALAPGPIGAGAPGNPRPSLTDQAPIVPPSGGHNQKRLRLAAKQFDPIPHADQVMTQVKLPLYCGLHSPLDLVAVEIIFGRVFEVFHRMSQAAATGATPVSDDKPLQKKHCQVSIVKTY